MSRSGNGPKADTAPVRVSTVMRAKDIGKIAANQRAQLYYDLHPGSPSAVRSPRLFVRSGIWIALLGQSVRQGIAGFGPTIEAALCLRRPVSQHTSPARRSVDPGSRCINQSKSRAGDRQSRLHSNNADIQPAPPSVPCL